MKITIEPTDRFESFEGVRCRIWKGVTDKGTPVQVMVPCVRAKKEADQQDLEAELKELKASRELVSFDTRML